MAHRIVMLVLCVLLSASAFAAGGEKSAVTRTATDGERTIPRAQRLLADIRHVGFVAPASLDDVFRSAAESGVHILAVTSRFAAGERELTDFIVVHAGEDADGLSERLATYRREAISDTEANATTLEPGDKEAVLAEMKMARAALSREAAEPSGVRVLDMTVAGEAVNVEEFLRSRPDAIRGPRVMERERELTPTEETLRVTSQAAVPATWYPNSGTAVVGKAGTGTSERRTAQQWLKWNNPSFTSTQTYEHDFAAYNYDRKSYLNTASSPWPGCWPVVDGYVQTSFPSETKPYIDTRYNVWQCEIDEVPFTVGIARANQVKANTTYYTYFRTTKGNATSSKFKLQGQLGHRSPTWCDSTWCSFGDDFVKLIPFTTFPGTVGWTKK